MLVMTLLNKWRQIAQPSHYARSHLPLATVPGLHGRLASLTPTTVPELQLDCTLPLFTEEEGGSGGGCLDSWLLASHHRLRHIKKKKKKTSEQNRPCQGAPDLPCNMTGAPNLLTLLRSCCHQHTHHCMYDTQRSR